MSAKPTTGEKNDSQIYDNVKNALFWAWAKYQ